jgi:carbonic anhydrase/acetyltransferase-like protein (isoleucine patch superfamily)
LRISWGCRCLGRWWAWCCSSWCCCCGPVRSVGANALVIEGKELPDNSLIVGAPAKVMRTLDAVAVEKLRASALHYVVNWRRFAAGLKRIE